MKIAIAHFRVGETDGVSLEMEKWKIVLEKLGHEVIFLAGSKGSTDAYVIDELHYKHPLNDKFVTNAYDELVDYESPNQLKQAILDFSEVIERKLIKFIENEDIDLLVPNNIWSLGWGLPAGIAFAEAVKKTKTPCIAHHHDFHWERDRYQAPTDPFITELLTTYFPPDLPHVRHVVINKIAQQELHERRGIEATVVPNVFDFSVPSWGIDDFNQDFREAINVGENDLLILQATRIAERKAIELGIDVVAEIMQPENRDKLLNKPLPTDGIFTKDSKIVYVLAGLEESTSDYLVGLKQKAETRGVDLRLVNERIEHSREVKDGRKHYALWDAYVHSDYVTYPSILEGWGNQLLEAVFAKKPMVVYEYPVYGTDIKSEGFSFVSLGDTHTVTNEGFVEVDHNLIEEAAKAIVDLLTSPEAYRQVTEDNFTVAKEKYSYEALGTYLAPLFSNATVS